MKKRTYIINLTEAGLKKITKGKTLKLKWLDFNIEVERSEYHSVSCITQLHHRGGKFYK